VHWRFSDAGKHRVQLQCCDPASEKPAQGATLVDAAAKFRFEPFLHDAAPHSNGSIVGQSGR
jgi:hypothetical protein